MSQPLRIEDPSAVNLITTRTRGSKLWFVRCPKFERKVLGYLAKYQEAYHVIIYAFVFVGNHYHLIAQFPRGNRAAFMRDFNSITARLCHWHIEGYDGGTLWGRRYAEQTLPNPQDVEEYFFYCALQVVLSGLCERIEDYPSYNSFYDAIADRAHAYTVVNWMLFRERQRFDPHARVEDFQTTYRLTFSRLPGYGDLTVREYKALMQRKLNERSRKLIAQRYEKGLGFAGRAAMRKTVRGSAPRTTKTSPRYSRRPLVLTLCVETRTRFLNWYFIIKESFIRASKQYREGILDTVFPPGTYRPLIFCSP